MTELIVAAAQIESVPGDIARNLDTHLLRIREARERGVGLLVFPELSLAGHHAGAEALRLGMSGHDPVLSTLAAACGGMVTVVGFVEEAPGALFYNSVATLSHGRVVQVHRKIALATYGKLDDGKYFGHGNAIDLVDLVDLDTPHTPDLSPHSSLKPDPPWRLATPVCADWWNPALVHATALAGATVCAAPISSAIEAVGMGFDNPGGWTLALSFYALVYGMPIVMANRVGQEGGLTFWGGSRIVGPDGMVIAQSHTAEETLVVGTLDYAAVRHARFALPTIRDAGALKPLVQNMASRKVSDS
jgi:predicted amidohydrolase